MTKEYYAVIVIPSEDDTMQRKRLPRPHKITRTWMIPPPLTQNQITVLRTLAKEGPANCYQIAKSIAKSRNKRASSSATRSLYSMVFKSLKDLDKRGIVEFKGEERAKKGTTSKIFDLALRGVLLVLERELWPAYTELENRSFVHKVIRKYDSLLPLVFGKWSFFGKMGVGKMALLRLKVVIDSERRLDDPRSSINIQQIYQGFFFFGFFPYQWGLEGSGIMAQPKAWVSAWKQDKDIRDWVIKDLEDYQQKLGRARVYVRKAISLVKG